MRLLLVPMLMVSMRLSEAFPSAAHDGDDVDGEKSRKIIGQRLARDHE